MWLRWVFILGANLGNRAATLRAAISMMQETAILTHIVVSPLLETEPVGYTEQPSFLNCACVVSVFLTLMI
ncbi:MAG: 2-amino-4-hydroxy-6-hydroxymethyldihydropteridine diphosphokinase [Ignavibacteria bacterium]|nr:2-amino-4-hydroxy-6-hydroxymethyldihydropteridine diphosphokinase [Ignavibacteria bacterium]